MPDAKVNALSAMIALCIVRNLPCMVPWPPHSRFDNLYDLIQLLDKCRIVPTAVLSRQTAGLRNKSLIINLPGKPKAIRETIDEVGSTNDCDCCVHALYALRLHAARDPEPV